MGSEALTYTVAVGSPAGAIVLYFYARSIRICGPQTTLRVSAISCIAIVFIIIAVCWLGHLQGASGKAIVVIFYAFREM